MSDIKNTNLVCVIGHTAGGKTAFAARLASIIDGEIISADSRQVYRYMDIGTGKDREDYKVEGEIIPHHLIDIVDPGYEYNVFEYQRDFLACYQDILARDRMPVLCGGTGMYIEAVLNAYKLIKVPPNPVLREELKMKSHQALIKIFESYTKPHNVTDTGNLKRLIRAIEIEDYYQRNPHLDTDYPELKPVIFGIRFERENRRERITGRLRQRLNNGMVREAEKLLEMGIKPEKLIYYGLEYKYLVWYIEGRLKYDEMFNKLNTAIHQFPKRQMTWFRGMERRGFKIHWLQGERSMASKLNESMDILAEIKN